MFFYMMIVNMNTWEMFKLGLKSLYPHLYYTTMHIFFHSKILQSLSLVFKNTQCVVLILVVTLQYHAGLILLSVSLLLWTFVGYPLSTIGHFLPVEKESLLFKFQEAQKSKRSTGPLPKVVYAVKVVK